jgi:hypothetical protein
MKLKFVNLMAALTVLGGLLLPHCASADVRSPWYSYDYGRRQIKVTAGMRNPFAASYYAINSSPSIYCLNVRFRSSHIVECTKQWNLAPHQFQVVGDLRNYDQRSGVWTYFPDQILWRIMPGTADGTWAAYQYWNPMMSVDGTDYYYDNVIENSSQNKWHVARGTTFGYDLDSQYFGVSITSQIYWGCW